MKKSKNLVKSIGTVCLSALSLAGVCAGSIAFVDYAKTGFTGQRPQTEQTQNNDKFVETYEFIGDLSIMRDSEGNINSDSMLMIEGFYGSASRIIVPATVSLGDLERHDYVFNSFDEFYSYTEKVNRMMNNTGASDPWGEPFSFTYSFLCADNTLLTASNYREIECFRTTLQNDKAKFPIKHTGEIQTFKQGTDIKVALSLRAESYSSKITHIKFGKGIDSINIQSLAQFEIIPEFASDDEVYGDYKYSKGLLVNTKTKTLEAIYKSAVAGSDTFTVPGDIEKVNFYAFERLSNLSKVIIPEGVKYWEGSFKIFEEGKINSQLRHTELYMPASIECGTPDISGGYQGIGDYSVVFLKKVPWSTNTGYTEESIDSIKWALGFENDNYAEYCAKYVVEDDEYERIIAKYPELSNYSEYFIKKSNYHTS